IETKVHPPAGASPFPVLSVSWDSQKYGINSGELNDLLLSGEPRVMSHAGGEGYSFIIRPAAMQAGDEKLVAARLVEIFTQNAGPKSRPAPASPVSVAGRWDADVRYIKGHAHHTLFLEQDGNKLTGTHRGRTLQGEMAGLVDGDKVRVHSSLRVQGQTLNYTFIGRVSGDDMQGDVDLGEYGKAKFTAKRHHYRAA
ncbi:MAG TPA: hypothetical protein VEU62_21155, partial [Bryobacterales bacterium]|nr:hypothetical protein [Bryobacterales bacterium]